MGFTLAGLLYIGAVWLRLVPFAEPVPAYGPMFDAYGIWNAWDGGLYDIPWLEYEAYVYSPAFAQLIYPLTLLPWEVFAALWTGLAIAILFWMRVPWMLADAVHAASSRAPKPIRPAARRRISPTRRRDVRRARSSSSARDRGDRPGTCWRSTGRGPAFQRAGCETRNRQ